MGNVVLNAVPGTPIEAGADNAAAVNERLAKIPDDSVVIVRGTITHDKTIEIRNKRDFTIKGEKPTDGFQTLTDTGTLDPPGARTRAHLRVVGGERVAVCAITVRGTHPDSGPNRSPSLPSDYWQTIDDDPSNDKWPVRNIWEDQTAVDFRGCNNWRVTDANLENVWGDFVSAAGTGAGTSYVQSSGGTITGGVWKRNGRCAVTPYIDNFHWEGTKVLRRVSSLYHIEIGGNPRLAIHNHTIRKIDEDNTGGRIVTMSSGALMENILITEIVADEFDVFVNGARDAQNNALARKIYVRNNIGLKPINTFCKFNDVTIGDIINNVMIVERRNNPTPGGIGLTGCTEVTTVPNSITFV